MSTPIFDATLADAPVNIWQASSIFPRPQFAKGGLIPALPARPSAPPLQPAFTDWDNPAHLAFHDPRWTAKVTGAVA